MDKIIVQSMRQQAVKGSSIVPLDKMKTFYKDHLKEFTTDEQIHLRMIILRSADKGSPEQRKRFLEEIRTRVAGGAKFADMQSSIRKTTQPKAVATGVGSLRAR
jgi:hypothetical protein